VDHVVLGRTGLDVSVAGLGGGGQSRLGLKSGASFEESVAIVHAALDLGITFFDTAPTYGTEEVFGAGLDSHRDEIVLSSKFGPNRKGGELFDGAALRTSVEESLRRLDTDRIDLFHLQGVAIADYDYCVGELVPVLDDLRHSGAVRFLAISERFQEEPDHAMLERATREQPDWFDVAMVGFSMLNPTARNSIFPAMAERGIGVEVMFAVRRLLSHPADLAAAAAGLVADGHVPAGSIDPRDPFGFLIHEGGATSVIDAAYRFARHEPGCHVVLTGTGSVDHLRENVASITAPRLPEDDLRQLHDLFGHLDVLTGE
jgi:aryl-alcohol dehydrogenase-like predicted oxidoreductase